MMMVLFLLLVFLVLTLLVFRVARRSFVRFLTHTRSRRSRRFNRTRILDYLAAGFRKTGGLNETGATLESVGRRFDRSGGGRRCRIRAHHFVFAMPVCLYCGATLFVTGAHDPAGGLEGTVVNSSGVVIPANG